MPKPASADGWIEWNGGSCPVAPETKVYWQRRIEADDPVERVERERRPAGELRWFHHGGPTDIIAYKPLPSPEKPQ